MNGLPNDLLFRIFSLLQPPLPDDPFPVGTRLISLPLAPRNKRTKRPAVSTPYEVLLASVCRKWREVAITLPHAASLYLLAYLSTSRVLRVSLTLKGLDDPLDIFSRDSARMAKVTALTMPFPGVSVQGLATVLARVPDSKQIKLMQFWFRRPEFLSAEVPWDCVGPAVEVLECFAKWLEVGNRKQIEQEVDEEEGGNHSAAMDEPECNGGRGSVGGVNGSQGELSGEREGSGSVGQSDTFKTGEHSTSGPIIQKPGDPPPGSPQSGLLELRLLSSIFFRTLPLRTLHRLAAACSGLESLTLRGIQSSVSDTISSGGPVHAFCTHNPKLRRLRVETGGCDLFFIARASPGITHLHLGDVPYMRSDLSLFHNLIELSMGRDERGWGDDGQDRDGWPAGRLLQSLTRKAFTQIRTLTLGRIPLKPLLEVLIPEHPPSVDLPVPPRLRDLTARPHPRMPLPTLSHVLLAAPNLTDLDISIDTLPLPHELRNAVLVKGGARLKNLIVRVEEAVYLSAVGRKEVEAAVPGCKVVVKQDV